MLGAIVGDIIGSRYEFHNYKGRNFELLGVGSHPTDDSAMTLAVAAALMEAGDDADALGPCAVRWMRRLGAMYPKAGYGGRFRDWLACADPKPYGSWGNGAAMRVSPVGIWARSEEEVKRLSRAVTAVTHDHPEGLKGAEATAMAIYLARNGASKADIRARIERDYYRIDFTLDEIRPSYRFDVSCPGSVPQAMEAFFESDSFEDAIRGAVSIGGDSDTIAAIAGGVAEAYYGIPEPIVRAAEEYLDEYQRDALKRWEGAIRAR